MTFNAFTTGALAALVVAAAPASGAVVSLQGTYYEDSATAACNAVSLCTVKFARLPAGKYVTVRHVSCGVFSTQPILTLRFGVRDTVDGETSRATYLPFVANPTGNATYAYNVNQEVFFKSTPLRYPFVIVSLTASAQPSVFCSFYGELS